MTRGRPPSREPWWACKVGLRRSDKMAALPSDSARIGWVYLLCEAKMQRRMGAFFNAKSLSELMGKYGKFVAEWVRVGLLEVAPELCERCTYFHTDAQPGEMVVHDFRREQRDPSAADRQAIKRGNSSRDSHADVTAQSVTNGGISHGDVTPTTGARGTTVTVTENLSTSTPLGAVDRPTVGMSREREPRLTRAQLDGWATFTELAWEPFKAAWLARGFLHPPFGNPGDDADTSQRARLWHIADDQPKALGQWVKDAPGKSARDVIAYVFTQRSKVAQEAGAEEAETIAEQDERKRDRHPMASLGDILAGKPRDAVAKPEPDAMDTDYIGGAS